MALMPAMPLTEPTEAERVSMETGLELVLPGQRIPMTTQLALGNNGARWRDDERGFDYHDSVGIIKALKHRTARDIVCLGLELLWAKAHLKHGRWLEFLEEVDMHRSASSRFMKYAKSYMVQQRMMGEGESKPRKHQITTAMKALNQDVAMLHNLPMREFWGMKPTADFISGSVETKAVLGFNLFKIIGRIREHWAAWNEEERSTAIETLRVWVELAEGVIRELEAQSSEKEDPTVTQVPLALRDETGGPHEAEPPEM